MTFQFFTRLSEPTTGPHGEPVTVIEHPDVFFQFPGGEWDMKLGDLKLDGQEYAYLRGSDPNDIVKLGLWGDAVSQHFGRGKVIIPYLPAARADHEVGDNINVPLGAKVYAELISSAVGFNVNQIVCFDPHSEVMPDWLGDTDSVTSASFLRGFAREWGITGVIVPDKGAFERSRLVAAALGVPTYQAEKHRDFATGKLSGFSVEPLPDGGKFLVADDICDGGGTFIGLAKATGLPREQLALYVSHGIFSGSAADLWSSYSEIHTTDSLDTASRIGATVHTLRPHLESFLDFSY